MYYRSSDKEKTGDETRAKQTPPKGNENPSTARSVQNYIHYREIKTFSVRCLKISVVNGLDSLLKGARRQEVHCIINNNLYTR